MLGERGSTARIPEHRYIGFVCSLCVEKGLLCALLLVSTGAITGSQFLKDGFSRSDAVVQCSCLVSYLGGSPGAAESGMILPQCSMKKLTLAPFAVVIDSVFGKVPFLDDGIRKVITLLYDDLSSSVTVWCSNLEAVYLFLMWVPSNKSSMVEFVFTTSSTCCVGTWSIVYGIFPSVASNVVVLAQMF